jgi:hypothetical protein
MQPAIGAGRRRQMGTSQNNSLDSLNSTPHRASTNEEQALPAVFLAATPSADFDYSRPAIVINSPPVTSRAPPQTSHNASSVFTERVKKKSKSAVEHNLWLPALPQNRKVQPPQVLFTYCQNRSGSYFTTDGQSVCLGVEPTLELVTRYYFLSEGCCLKVAVFFLWGALSDERTGLRFAVQSRHLPSLLTTVSERIQRLWKLLLSEFLPSFLTSNLPIPSTILRGPLACHFFLIVIFFTVNGERFIEYSGRYMSSIMH